MNSRAPFSPISGLSGTSRRAPPTFDKTSGWIAVVPVPADAPRPPAAHFKLGRPTTTWTYTDAAGDVLGHVLRFDMAGGEKVFRPLVFMRRTSGEAKAEWRWESWPTPRPLYGLRDLAERPAAPVVITEGEKACDAARLLLPSAVVITSPNGSKSAGKSDWSVLRGRDVVIWPDADAAGFAYARTVAGLVREAGASSVMITMPPPGVTSGWDAADALAEGWSTNRADDLITATVTPEEFADATASAPASRNENVKEEDKAAGGRRRPPQRDLLIGLTECVALWHDANRTAFASFPVGGHREHWPVRGREFRMWLSGRFYEETGGAIGGQALEDSIRILEARAVNDGPMHECFTRIGYAGGAIYVDLGDPSWRAVEISAAGFAVVDKPPVKLMRSPSMRPLPEPEAGGLIEDLRQFVNVRSDEDFMLVVAWLVAALRHRGPFPVLAVAGEAGSGKSVFSRMMRSLVDPSAAPIRAVPRDDRDLVVSAGNSWVLAFDNLSAVPVWLADALCRLATGSGFSTRMLHTDRDEMIFEAARPIIINGISSLTDRADLADRSVTIHLRIMAERRPEDELLAAFERARPRILGALFDAVSRALADIERVRLDHPPRMADFVKWVTAAAPGLGWDRDAFLAAYAENRHDVSEATFEADAVAVAIWKLLTTGPDDKFEGTATELLDAVNAMVPEFARRSRYWPQNAAQLGSRVARAAPLLRAKGCIVERRHSGSRTITILLPPYRFA